MKKYKNKIDYCKGKMIEIEEENKGKNIKLMFMTYIFSRLLILFDEKNDKYEEIKNLDMFYNFI